MIAQLPHFNAAINSLVAILLVVGLVLIKRGHHDQHKKVMLGALALSGLFFVSYITYHVSYGSTKFMGEGTARTVYFTLLLTHTVLAVVNLPMVIVTVTRALRGQLAKHKRIAKVTWVMWFYVAVTGPLVYLMLYQLYPSSRDYARYAYARALHKAGQEQEALGLYRELGSKIVGAECFAAVVGDRLEGTHAAKSILEKNAGNRDCDILRAREFVYDDQLDAAIQVLTEIVSADATEDFAQASLGFALFRKMEYERAAGAFESALTLTPMQQHPTMENVVIEDPTIATNHANAGYAHYHYGEYTKARPHLVKALQLGLEDDFAERIKEALEVIDGARWICPMHPHVTGKKGDVCGECKMNLEPAKAGPVMEESP